MRMFLPWIGSEYCQGGFNGIRLLVLGESHYGTPGEEHSEFTRDVVRELGQEKRRAFFTKINKVALGLGTGDWISDEQRKEFWEQVSFYNYVQSFLHEARHRPTQKMWEEAQAPFLQTIKELSPHCILVLGQELESNLPNLPAIIVVCGIQHPSYSGFTYEPWVKKIKKAIQNISTGT